MGPCVSSVKERTLLRSLRAAARIRRRRRTAPERAGRTGGGGLVRGGGVREQPPRRAVELKRTLQTPHIPVHFFFRDPEKPGFCSGFESVRRRASVHGGAREAAPGPTTRVAIGCGAGGRGGRGGLHAQAHVSKGTNDKRREPFGPRPASSIGPVLTPARPPSSPQAPASASRARPEPPDGGSCPEPSSPRRGSWDRTPAPRG